MTNITASSEAFHGRSTPTLHQKTSPVTAIIFFALLAAALATVRTGFWTTSRRRTKPWRSAFSRCSAWRF